MFLTAKETGGPAIFALRQPTRYLAVWRLMNTGGILTEFDIRHLAKALGQNAGETWQEHASLIKLACMEGKLFEWLNTIGGET